VVLGDEDADRGAESKAGADAVGDAVRCAEGVAEDVAETERGGVEGWPERHPGRLLEAIADLEVGFVGLALGQVGEEIGEGSDAEMLDRGLVAGTVETFDGVVEGADAGREPEALRGVAGEFGVEDDDAGRKIGRVDARLAPLVIGEAGRPVVLRLQR
jgi:hypothetical protein